MAAAKFILRNPHRLKADIFGTYCRKRYLHILLTTLSNRIQTFGCYSNRHNNKSVITFGGPSRSCHGDTSYEPSSALYVSGISPEFSPFLEVDLDLKTRLADIDELQRNLNARGMQDKVDLKQLVNDYRLYEELQEEKRVSKLEKTEKEKYWKLEEKVMLSALKLPNYLHQDTTETSEVLEEIGSNSSVSNKKSHIHIGQKHNLIKFSDIGKKAYYLKGDLAVLEQTLIDFVSTRLRHNGFIQTNIPELFRTIIVEGTGVDFTDPKQVYQLEQRVEGKHVDNLPLTGYFVRGVSLMSFAAMVCKKLYRTQTLPLHYFTSGRSYITESEQEKLPGLFGALQSMKINVFGMCGTSDEASAIYNTYRNDSVELYKLFNLPLRLTRISASALHPSEQLRTEVHLWAPGVQQYIKVASVSLIGDYLSRRLMCRHSKEINHKKKRLMDSSSVLYMVHGEILDVTRLIAILMEYGSVDSSVGKYRLPELKFLDDSFGRRRAATQS